LEERGGGGGNKGWGGGGGDEGRLRSMELQHILNVQTLCNVMPFRLVNTVLETFEEPSESRIA